MCGTGVCVAVEAAALPTFRAAGVEEGSQMDAKL